LASGSPAADLVGQVICTDVADATRQQDSRTLLNAVRETAAAANNWSPSSG
jgi:hypothetical protein